VAYATLAVVPNVTAANALAVDATSVFWIEAQAVKSAPKGGGGSVTVLGDSQLGPVGLALDATNVYWANSLGAAIMTAAKGAAGGATVVAAANQPAGVAVDSTYVYWVNKGDGAVLRVAKSGGGQPLPVATVSSGTPTSIAVDDTNVYVSTDAAILQGPKAGGALTTFVSCSASSGLTSVVVDAVTVDWVCGEFNSGAGSVMPVLFTSDKGSNCFTRLGYGTYPVTSGAWVYGYFRAADAIAKMPKLTGAIVSIAYGWLASGPVATDDQYVYWYFGGGGGVNSTGIFRAPQ
jgi:hypothetical protein